MIYYKRFETILSKISYRGKYYGYDNKKRILPGSDNPAAA
jgi:hypothetical protein